MKAEIKADGTLKITSETELEAYALGQWVSGNEAKDGKFNSEHFIVYTPGIPSPLYPVHIGCRCGKEKAVE